MNFAEDIFRPIKRKLVSGEVRKLLFTVLSRERVIGDYAPLVSRHHNILVSTWFAFDAAVLGFDFSNNQLRFADVQGIRLPFNLNLLKL